MSKFLIYTSPARGHLFPMVPVLQQLQQRGHDVAIRTLASEVPSLVAMGFDAAPMSPAIERIEHDDWKARTPFAANRRVLRVFAERAHHEVPDIRTAIDEVRPDALIIDISTEGAAAVAQAGGLPWAHYTPYPVPLPSRDVPPFGLGLQPRAGLWGRVRDAAARRWLLDPLLSSDLGQINALRRELDVPTFTSLAEQWLQAPLHLLFTAEPFDYPRSDRPASFRLVGPGVWEPPAEAPEWLASLDRPIVLVSTSSEFQNDRSLVELALKALADEDVCVVATTPSADPASFDTPANARVERFVPHGPVLERASCVVTHGGMGVTQKALAAGVPVCAVPFGRDQLEVAGRVVAARAGTRVFPMALTARRLRRAVRGASEKREGAQRLATAFAAIDGPSEAASALEALLAGPSRRDIAGHVGTRAPVDRP